MRRAEVSLVRGQAKANGSQGTENETAVTENGLHVSFLLVVAQTKANGGQGAENETAVADNGLHGDSLLCECGVCEIAFALHPSS
jgi:hypothetical protein